MPEQTKPAVSPELQEELQKHAEEILDEVLLIRSITCARVEQLGALLKKVEKETGGLPNRGAAHAFALYGAMITLTQIFLHFDENALDLLLQSIATLIDIETESYSKGQKDSIIALLKQKEE